jgi:hypothetical protein
VVRASGTTNLGQFPLGKIARHPPGKLPGSLRVETFAEGDGRLFDFLFPGIDERIQNAVAVFSGGSDRREALRHEGEIVDLPQILANRFQLGKNSRREWPQNPELIPQLLRSFAKGVKVLRAGFLIATLSALRPRL